MNLQRPPIAKAEMLIRKPVADVFEALVNPDITTKFWFTRSSGRLEEGKNIQWAWEMYGVSTQVTVKVLERDKQILVDWGNPPTQVEWRLSPRADDTTFVRVINSGFAGSSDEMVSHAIDSTEGFAFLLAGLKAYLEHDLTLNLVPDHAPDAHIKSGS